MTEPCGHQQNLHPLPSENRPIHPRIRMLRYVSRIQQNRLKSDFLLEVTGQASSPSKHPISKDENTAPAPD
jgi:hypothetical protein